MATFCSTKPRVDYSVGILSLFVYCFFVATAKEINYLLFIPIFLQAIILRIDVLKVLKKVLKVYLFVFVTFLILVFEGKYDLALLVFVRANLILWFTLSFNYDGFKIYKGIQNLRLSNKFAMVLFFTVKYIEVLLTTAIRLKEVLKIRGFKGRFEKNTFKTYGDLFAFLLYTSVNKIEKVEDVINLRTKDEQLMPLRRIELGLNEILLFGSIIGVIFVYYFT